MPPSTSVGGPVIPKRRIAKELRLLREGAHLRLDEVAEKTDVSTSTLSRLENAQGTANALTIRALVDFYDLTGTERGERLKLWAKQGRKHGWWQEFPEAAAGVSPYVDYESQAAVANIYVIPYIAVLFQTPDYAEALARGFDPQRSEGDLKQLVNFRMRRQDNLVRRDNPEQRPLEVNAILHESCLYQFVGSASIMREQLNALISVATSPEKDVKIQILSRRARVHQATRCGWSHFAFPENIDNDVVFLETHMDLISLEDNRTADARRHHDELSERSYSEDESLQVIGDAIDAWTSEM